MLLAVPKTKTKLYGDRSFAAKAPRLWNALPVDINPFPAKGFTIDEQNRLALNRVKSVSALSTHTAVKGLRILNHSTL